MTSTAIEKQKSKIRAFTFGAPEPVLNSYDFLSMIECCNNGQYYQPPISLSGLAKSFQISPHHSSAILLKRNLIMGALQPSKYLTRQDFGAIVQDYLVFGNAYCELIQNRLNQPLNVKHTPALYMRRGLKPDQFFFVPFISTPTEFDNPVLQLRQPDINQEIYGIPEYLGALQAAQLNEAATLFRRRYYLNGAHAGFIMYLNGSDFDEDDINQMQEQINSAKGPGNFKNMFIHAPEGKESGIKIIPIAEVGAKDEFLGIKNTTRDDILAAHRVPPQLLGMVPQNGSGFGDVTKATAAFFQLEIEPLMSVFEQINDWTGQQIVTFKQQTDS